MTRAKITFLLIMGLSIVGIALSRESFMTDMRKSHQADIVNISWNGSQVVGVENKYIATEDILEKNLPAELCPIFFYPIPLNLADEKLLITLPGIGLKTADLILRKRLEIGRINDSRQLLSINGIGDKTVELLERYTTYE